MNQDTYVPGYAPTVIDDGMKTFAIPAPSLGVGTGVAPQSWNLFGDTLQDGFQFSDLGSWGKNLMGGVQQGLGAVGQNLGTQIENNHTNLPEANQFGNIMGGLQTLSGLYGGYKQLSMANKQFDAQKDMWNKSWDASKKNINEGLEYRSLLRNNNNSSKAQKDMDKYSV